MRNKIIPSSFIILLVFVTSGAQSKELKISVEEYQDKVYASWLAQCIGNIYGLPHENRYIDEPGPETFPYGYDERDERLKQANGAFSDDDTDIEYMYLLAMEKYGTEPTYAQLAKSWKYHVRNRVWLANRAALGAMHYGFTPPVTGIKVYNPHWFQIDPQLVNEIWAVTAPGMVDYAAQKSAWAARITNDDWGIEPTIHYAAMYSAAFFESDIHRLIDIATAALPENSRFAQTVEEMKALYQKYPDDWKMARKEMAEKYYHNEPIDTKTIWNANLNGACGILALLYGQGDFQKTLDLSCAIGFDADNQAATMSGLLGVVHGTERLPKELLFPFPQLDWKQPFNDIYKNITRYDMPDASLKDMAARMAKQAEKIIFMHGGKKVTVDGKNFYVINADAKFTAPLEFPNAPMPIIEVGKKVEYDFFVSGGSAPYKWQVISSEFPKGLTFADGHVSGTATSPGVYPVTLAVTHGQKKLSQDFKLVVRGKNLAHEAIKILANVKNTDTKKRDAMWLTVARSLYSDHLDDVIRDGKVTGSASTFYSINDSPKPKKDYFGYEWAQPQTIGLLGFHTGSMEENGGWFTSLDVQYQSDHGTWKSVENLVISPALVKGNKPHNKPHFVEYLLAFQPVKTTAIRMIGNAGGSKHWYSKPTYFTSISELSAHGQLPNFENLAK